MTIETKELVWLILGICGFLIAGLLAVTGKFIWKVAEGYENSIKELNLAWGKNNTAIDALAKSMNDLAKEMRTDRELTDTKYKALQICITENHDVMMVQDMRHDVEIDRLRLKSHEYGNILTTLLAKADLKDKAEILAKKLQEDFEDKFKK